MMEFIVMIKQVSTGVTVYHSSMLPIQGLNLINTWGFFMELIVMIIRVSAGVTVYHNSVPSIKGLNLLG